MPGDHTTVLLLVQEGQAVFAGVLEQEQGVRFSGCSCRGAGCHARQHEGGESCRG